MRAKGRQHQSIQRPSGIYVRRRVPEDRQETARVRPDRTRDKIFAFDSFVGYRTDGRTRNSPRTSSNDAFQTVARSVITHGISDAGRPSLDRACPTEAGRCGPRCSVRVCCQSERVYVRIYRVGSGPCKQIRHRSVWSGQGCVGLISVGTSSTAQINLLFPAGGGS
jgi:hypothetical protein